MKAYKDLLKRKNVIAIGRGKKVKGNEKTEEDAIVISVTRKKPLIALSKKDVIPASIEGVSTDVIPTGTIRAQFNIPVTPGISCGHYAITAGTLGAFVKKGADVYILSNNHVLANSNAAEFGDAILVPGPIDGGVRPKDVFARLYSFIPIKLGDTEANCKIAIAAVKFLNAAARAFGSRVIIPNAVYSQDLAESNFVDGALAGPVNMDWVDLNIPDIGMVEGMVEAEIDMEVQKQGRTTGYTKDKIYQLEVTAAVEYAPGQTAIFENQIMAGGMSAGGDSGSLVLDMDNRAVGLLFAGSDQVTLMNPIDMVMDELEIDKIL